MIAFQDPVRLLYETKMRLTNGQQVTTVAATDGKTFWESSGDKIEEYSGKKAEAFNHKVKQCT
jgi:hypothetical protein